MPVGQERRRRLVLPTGQGDPVCTVAHVSACPPGAGLHGLLSHGQTVWQWPPHPGRRGALFCLLFCVFNTAMHVSHNNQFQHPLTREGWVLLLAVPPHNGPDAQLVDALRLPSVLPLQCLHNTQGENGSAHTVGPARGGGARLFPRYMLRPAVAIAPAVPAHERRLRTTGAASMLRLLAVQETSRQ